MVRELNWFVEPGERVRRRSSIADLAISRQRPDNVPEIEAYARERMSCVRLSGEAEPGWVGFGRGGLGEEGGKREEGGSWIGPSCWSIRFHMNRSMVWL